MARSPARRIDLDHQHHAVRSARLDFDRAAATEAAALAAARHKSGRPIDMRDIKIAGIALARRATLATRNVRHFQDLSVAVIDPWEAGAH